MEAKKNQEFEAFQICRNKHEDKVENSLFVSIIKQGPLIFKNDHQTNFAANCTKWKTFTIIKF